MKVAFVSSMLPSGHFSQYITSGLAKVKGVELLIYTDQDEKNLSIKGCGTIKTVWTKSPQYIFQIVKQLLKDRPDVVHIQQELNMYGGILTVLLFPLLLFMIRLMGIKVVTTIHASVFKVQIDDEFVRTFHKNPKVIKPQFLIWLFQYLFLTCSLISNEIIVHSALSKKILVQDYWVDGKKVQMIKTAIPTKQTDNTNKKNYFFYFGYMVRRKGLEFLLRGFARFIRKHPDTGFKLVLAGGTIKGQESALDEVKQLIKALDLRNTVEIKGYIEEKQQDKLYQHAYAVVIPAIFSMGSSGPLYHAFSYAKCVIATKMGHFLYDIQEKKTGLLTSNDKWAEALEFAVKHPNLISKIEEQVEKEKADRTPYSTALKYLKVYNL